MTRRSDGVFVERARTLWAEAIQLFQAAGEVPGLAFQLDNFAAIADHDGNRLRAARLSGAALAHQTRRGADLGQILREQLGRSGLKDPTDVDPARAFAEGQAMTLGEAVAYALRGAMNAAIEHG